MARVKKGVTNKTEEVTNVSPEMQNLVEAMNKKFGKNAVRIGISKDKRKREYISTGILQLDKDLNGGIPVGRVTEISGENHTGKSTLALHIMAEAQKKGLMCGLIDVEGTSDDIDYMNACGVDSSKLIISNPASLEEALAIAEMWQKSGEVHVCMFDSIASSLATKTVLEAEIGESRRMGTPQQELAEYFIKYQMANNGLSREDSRPFTLIVINQLRSKINSYGDPDYTPGGRAKEFAYSVRIRLRKGDWIKEKDTIVGQITKYKIDKNKLGIPYRSGEVDFYFDENNSAGVPALNYDVFKDMVLVGVVLGVINKSGGWYSYHDIEKVQGIDKFTNELRQREDLIEKLREEVLLVERGTK